MELLHFTESKKIIFYPNTGFTVMGYNNVDYFEFNKLENSYGKSNKIKEYLVSEKIGSKELKKMISWLNQYETA